MKEEKKRAERFFYDHHIFHSSQLVRQRDHSTLSTSMANTDGESINLLLPNI